MKAPRSFFVFPALVLVCAASAAWGQAVTATLVGNVSDSSGGIVIGSKVVATETNTGVTRTAATNESGNYSFPNVPPGTYSVTAEQSGFKKATRSGIDVIVNAPPVQTWSSLRVR